MGAPIYRTLPIRRHGYHSIDGPLRQLPIRKSKMGKYFSVHNFLATVQLFMDTVQIFTAMVQSFSAKVRLFRTWSKFCDQTVQLAKVSIFLASLAKIQQQLV